MGYYQQSYKKGNWGQMWAYVTMVSMILEIPSQEERGEVDCHEMLMALLGRMSGQGLNIPDQK